MTRTTTCTYHCSGCGSHFSSLGAFDAHRTGDYDSRVCDEPLDVGELAAKSERGGCDLGDRTRINVPVYALARDLDHFARTALSELVRRPSEGAEAAA
jgi:hypothetical protein